MCYSAEASLITGGVLICCGGVPALHMARPLGINALPLAVYPVFFGVQQMSEGILWLSLGGETPNPSVAAALVFLFFAYWVWPVWVPVSAAFLESDHQRRRLFLGLAGFGACLGAGLYLPALLQADALNIQVIRHSIHYGNATVLPGEVAGTATRLIYALVIVLPLIWSSHRGMRTFGYLILVSLLIGFAFASYAFTSIWCFLAAWLSIYILIVLRGLASDTDTAQRLEQG
ncbi:MAG: DUF6629 family protein [Marinibacterium sp.]